MARDDTRRQSHLMLESILPPIRETQKEEKASHVDLGNRSKDPVRLRKRRREGSSGDEMVDGTLDLAAVKTAQVGLDVGVFTAVKEESPWGSFEPIYDLKLGDFVTVAIRNTPEREIVIVKTLSGPGKDERLEVTRQVRHRNFLGLKDIFDYEGVFHNVFEFVPICLFHLVACPAYPTASQLAAIIAQVPLRPFPGPCQATKLTAADSRRDRVLGLPRSPTRLSRLFDGARFEGRGDQNQSVLISNRETLN